MKSLIRHLALPVVGIFAAVVMGCTALGVPAADTFNKKMAAGYATVQVVAESAKSAYTAGKLSEKDRTNVVTTTRAAIEGLDLAQTAYSATCPASAPPGCVAPAADAKLVATLAVLTALQAYLATQQGAK